jgi:hypothetical protein
MNDLRMRAGDPLLTEVVRRLVDTYDPERIYLFGSVARGDTGPDSDYDLMVIVPDSASPERRQSRWALQADPPLTEDAAFHCQQAVEKALAMRKGLTNHPPANKSRWTM